MNMTGAQSDIDLSTPKTWQEQSQARSQSVETLKMRSGASLVLSHFDPGAARSFRFAEPTDVFGFGFHLKDGASFELESTQFKTAALDVWAMAGPKGSVSEFILPSNGFRTVSIRFSPETAHAFFADGLALPQAAATVLKHSTEDTSVARLSSLNANQALRIESMFAVPLADTARSLYLEGCMFELLAGHVGGQVERSAVRIQPRHRKKAIEARDYLDIEFCNPPTTEELAKLIGTNAFTLKRAFKHTIGTTIYGYVSHRRMDKAITLLNEGMMVAAVAHEVGYGCPRSFSAAFQRAVGRPPSAVRRKRN